MHGEKVKVRSGPHEGTTGIIIGSDCDGNFHVKPDGTETAVPIAFLDVEKLPPLPAKRDLPLWLAFLMGMGLGVLLASIVWSATV